MASVETTCALLATPLTFGGTLNSALEQIDDTIYSNLSHYVMKSRLIEAALIEVLLVLPPAHNTSHLG